MQEIKLDNLTEEQKEKLLNFRFMGANKDQLIEFALAAASGCDIDIINTQMPAKKIREVRLYHKDNIDIVPFISLDVEKLKEIRYGIKCSRFDNRNISKYKDYSLDQIKFLNDLFNMGLKNEYISWLDNKFYSPDLMKEIFNALNSGLIKSKEELPIDENNSSAKNIELLKSYILKQENKVVEVVTQDDEIEEYTDSDDNDDTIFVF